MRVNFYDSIIESSYPSLDHPGRSPSPFSVSVRGEPVLGWRTLWMRSFETFQRWKIWSNALAAALVSISHGKRLMTLKRWSVHTLMYYMFEVCSTCTEQYLNWTELNWSSSVLDPGQININQRFTSFFSCCSFFIIPARHCTQLTSHFYTKYISLKTTLNIYII